jgi:L-fuculose-phosphate aldolase
MESLEFYAQLLYNSRALGGPKEFNEKQIEQLYEIRRNMGLKGKHPADICVNNRDGKKSCHTCGACSVVHGGASSDVSKDELVAAITKKVIEAMGK